MRNICITLLSVAAALFMVSCGPSDSQVKSTESPPVESSIPYSIHGWLNWRGESQAGISSETGLPNTLEKETALWSYEVHGAGTPVIANGRVFVFGYYGENEDLQEALICLDADSGEKIWEHRFSDFLSDIIYNRYAIGAPTVDAQTGNIYLMLSSGLAVAFDWNGKKIWERSMLEEFGRLTFPNGRTGCAVVDEERVIFRGITAAWGKQGPARDRFYAFDKNNGALLWISTPGVGPIDSSFSTPIFHDLKDGRRVFYSGTGCGNMICADARTGQELWRFQVSTGGVNATPALFGEDKLIVIHGKENLDSSEMGRLICLKIPTAIPTDTKLPMILGKDAELWRNNEDMRSFTSSPVVKDGIVYLTVATGELKAVDAATGEKLWAEKLAPDQIHASPLYADGKLYVPMFDGSFYVIKPSRGKAEVLSKVEFGEPFLGAPSVWAGRVYIHSKDRVYCFGSVKSMPVTPQAEQSVAFTPGEAKSLQIVPFEFLMKPGETMKFQLRSVDAVGHVVAENVTGANWEKYIPEGAKVKARVDAELQADGTLIASGDAKQSAGAIKATLGDLTGVTRGRVLAGKIYEEDFEDFDLNQKAGDETFSYPPLSWLAARMKWRIIETPNGKIAGNTLDKILFQRSRIFFGDPGLSNYTLQADVMTDGNRRIMSDIGLINQRYVINLVGNWKALEVSSNHDRLKVSAPFQWKANEWYTLKTRVDVNADGSGIIRGKVWKRSETEPETWTIEVPHQNAHTKGAPGIFAFSPQSKKRVYIDNIKLNPNQ